MSNTVNMGIPTATVNEVIDSLSHEFYSSVKAHGSCKYIPTYMLWGPPGVGKSDGVKQLASKLSALTGKRVEVRDLRLSLFTPSDILGVPFVDRESGSTVWATPKVFVMDDSEELINILFLDELSSASEDVQKAAYQICLDRKAGDRNFPDNCIVIAAGNRLTDMSISFRMSKALCNRLDHFDVCADYDSWRSWAVRNGINELVIAFIAFDNSRLSVTPTSAELAYATPRSWTRVSEKLNLANGDFDLCRRSIASAVGNGMAIEFEAFCRGAAKMPNPDEVLRGVCRTFPKTHDAMYALVSALVSRIAAKGDDIEQDALENAFSYICRLPEDFVMLFATDLKNIPTVNKKLMHCHAFQVWLNKR